ncbi:aldose 1-epimerase [Hesseltinella vesiculosa]|uniref:Aldose 1-epimerase n=1 Tax=Hesseltinella vesiculosa TaxID=101127 RepID=A0A1X2GFS3_9FUNG|nr:aldose 1-epimerase [Hesseltinella vesiculosa]
MPVTQLVLSDSENIVQYTLINDKKTLAVMVLNYGGIVSHILTPDKDGVIRDVVLGYDDYQGYTQPDNRYFGALVGRFANRIGQGKFTLDGKEYSLLTNNGPNALHGGEKGFDKQVWDVQVVSQQPPSIRLTYVSPDGDQGYPGTLTTHVTYTVGDDDSLTIDYEATLDMDAATSTIVNLTNHSYFNLAGPDLDPTVLNTLITMTKDVQGFLEMNYTNIPTGQHGTFERSPWMDFHTEKTIGQDIERVASTRGYDHPYVIHQDFVLDTTSLPLREAVVAKHPTSGIQLTFATTEPCFQFYTGNYISSDLKAKKAQHHAKLGPHAGFCLESSRFPDAPNHPNWRASVVVKPGEKYASQTVFKFSTNE